MICVTPNHSVNAQAVITKFMVELAKKQSFQRPKSKNWEKNPLFKIAEREFLNNKLISNADFIDRLNVEMDLCKHSFKAYDFKMKRIIDPYDILFSTIQFDKTEVMKILEDIQTYWKINTKADET